MGNAKYLKFFQLTFWNLFRIKKFYQGCGRTHKLCLATKTNAYRFKSSL